MNSEVRIFSDRVQITRVFDAPRPLVFSYWAQPDKLRLWSGRKDATSVEVEGDFRVGGGFRHKMTIRGAGRHTFSGTYEEIVEPEKIVYSANLGSATIRVIIQFYEQGEQTKVVPTQEGFPDPNLVKIVAGGTNESFEKLDQLLAVRASP
jgi:uncharacterized protein YndB with AHSA1/START domain